MPDVKRRPPTIDELRRRIDQGGAGDKVSFPDPAAAPLGTDDEASGAPPTPAQRATAAKQELGHQPTPQGRSMMPLWAMLTVVVLVAVAAWWGLAAR